MVSEIHISRQLALLELRREVEKLMASAAADRATECERERFASIAHAMERAAKSSDDRAFMRLDQEFNELVAQASRNEFAAGAMRLMSGLSRRFWYRHYKEALDLPRCARLHAAVARAIAQKDAKRAITASDELIDYIEEFTRATIEPRSRPRRMRA
jgi:DNA-binding GntR family transcriptional regulator